MHENKFAKCQCTVNSFFGDSQEAYDTPTKSTKSTKIGYVSKIPKTERNMHNMLKLKLLVKKGQLLVSRVTEITREL